MFALAMVCTHPTSSHTTLTLARTLVLARMVQVKELQKVARLVKKGKPEQVKLKPEVAADATAAEKRAVAHMYVLVPGKREAYQSHHHGCLLYTSPSPRDRG